MSRTRRIYNSEAWKKKAIRHYNSKYRSWYSSYQEDLSGEEILERGYVLYGGFTYHKYKTVCMGCCSFCAADRPRKRRHRRRVLRDMEINWEKY